MAGQYNSSTCDFDSHGIGAEPVPAANYLTFKRKGE